MKSSDTRNDGTPFSYSTPRTANTIVLYNYRSFQFGIDDKFRTTHVSANDGRWHHTCASWENKLGSWKLYKDGFVASSGIWFQAGRVIRSGGSLTLAQEQDSLGGSFEKHQGFIGMLTNVNVWNYVLSTAQIKQMSKVCLPGREGNVYKWSDFIHGREGKARVVMPSPCKPQAF
ncbi:neuronal pentraxin-1-like [Porites lutea]|uniref:neuronal pentraxin-1-like n=1 Tax=Porites lutea TaxID=51062 RepID=UPI003CC616F3